MDEIIYAYSISTMVAPIFWNGGHRS